jgi:4-hydroxybenzoate polyprenyltransferase
MAFSLVVASIYVVNQIMDIESDRINRKLFLLPQGLVSVRTAWIMAGCCAAGGMAIAMVFISSTALVVIFLLSLLLGVVYNLPPLQLKNNPFGGVCASALGHGLLTFLAGWYVAGTQEETGGIVALTSGLLSGLAPTLANAAVYCATTIPDAAGDRVTGKRTFCVAYGEKKTAIVSVLFCTAAFISSFFILNHCWVMAIPSGISIFIFLLFAVLTKKEHAFKAFLWPVFLLSIFVTLFVPEYGVLILLIYFSSRAYYKWRFGIDYPTLKTK